MSAASAADRFAALSGLAEKLRETTPRPLRGRLVRAVGTVLRAVMP